MAVELGVEGASAPREGASSDTEWGVSAAVSFEIPLASGVFLGPRIGVASRLYGESLDVIDVTLAALPMTRWLGRKWPVGVRIAPGVGYVSSYNGEPDQLVPLLSVGPLLEYQPFVRGSYEDLRSAAELGALAREAALCESWKTLAWTRTEASQGLAGEINARIARCEKIPSPAEAASALRRVQAQLLARQPGAGLGIRIGGQYTLRLSDPDPSWSLGFFGGLVF